MRSIEDDATRRAQPCPSSIEEEEITPKNRNKPELKEKANCPDCGKEVTRHGLRYTHKGYCKAKQSELRPAPMPKLERTATLENIAPLVPTVEQIAVFIMKEK